MEMEGLVASKNLLDARTLVQLSSSYDPRSRALGRDVGLPNYPTGGILLAAS
jgi:hypothetical protein